MAVVMPSLGRMGTAAEETQPQGRRVKADPDGASGAAPVDYTAFSAEDGRRASLRPGC